MAAIKEIRRDFKMEFGIDVSGSRIKQYGEIGLYKPSRASNGWRTYADSEAQKARTILMLVEIGVKLDDLKTNNTESINARIESITKILAELNRKRGNHGNNYTGTDRRKS